MTTVSPQAGLEVVEKSLTSIKVRLLGFFWLACLQSLKGSTARETV